MTTKAVLAAFEGPHGLRFRNRVMRSPTWENQAESDGRVTPVLVEEMRALARGHVGLIVVSHTFVIAEGRAGDGQLALDTDDKVPGFRQICDAVHSEGSLVGVQLAHAGRVARDLPRLGPSACDVRKPSDGQMLLPCQEMTLEDIDRTVGAFVAAARRAKEAGFDVIMLHGAHAYLMSEFLSPVTNHRSDAYGGSLENRARLLLRTVAAVKAEVGDAVPLAVKMNTEDFNPQGMTVEESSQVAVWLAKAGVALVEASGGGVFGTQVAIRKGKDSAEGYHMEGARSWKKAIEAAGCKDTLVALVGGIRTLSFSQRMLDEGVCDIISLSRPLIREPDLVLKWEKDPNYKSPCVSCCMCIESVRTSKGYCCPPLETLKKRSQQQK